MYRWLIAKTVATAGRFRGRGWSLGVLAWVVWPGSATPGEPMAPFLDGLIARGELQLATRYLERLGGSSRLDETQRAQIPFHLGRLRQQQASSMRDPQQRDALLKGALAEFQSYIDKASDGPQVLEARERIAQILVTQGHESWHRRDQQADAERADLQREGESRMQQAREQWGLNERQIRDRLEAIPKNLDRQRDAARIKERSELQARYVEAKLRQAMIVHELVERSPRDHPERAGWLADSKRLFGELAEKYRRRAAGLTAQLYQARGEQLAGDLKRSLAIYGEILDNTSTSPAVRKLRAQALIWSMECWLDGSLNLTDEAIRRGEEWLANLTAEEQRSPETLEVQWSLARAHEQKAGRLPAAEARDAIRSARRWATSVARHKSKWKGPAEQLLAKLGQVSDEGDAAAPVAEVKSFAEAQQRAQEILGKLEDQETMLRVLQPRLQQATNDGQRAEMQQAISKAEQEREALRAEALSTLQHALVLAPRQSPYEGLNDIRSLCGYVYYRGGDYHRAYLFASHVLRHYPQSPAAQRAGTVALSASAKLWEQASAAGKSLAQGRLADVAQAIATNMPDSQQALDAQALLLHVMIDRGDLRSAEESLQRLPAGSLIRARAAAQVGIALWQALQSATGTENGAGKDIDLGNEPRVRAQQLLIQALESQGEQPPQDWSLRGGIVLAQIFVEAGQASQAIDILRHPQRGPLTLLAAEHPLTLAPGLMEVIYRTALRAELAQLVAAPDDEHARSIRGLIQSIQAHLGRTPAGSGQLISIFLASARQLQQSLQNTQGPAKAGLIDALDRMLSEMAQNSTDIAILQWCVETYHEIGLASQSAGLTPQAERAFQAIESVTGRALELGQQGKVALNPTQQAQLHLKQAQAQKALGKFSPAFDSLCQILQQTPNVLDIQIEAAHVLQSWGDSGVPQKYTEAIEGSGPVQQGRRLVWGWSTLAAIAGRHAQHRATFIEARYQMAVCRYQTAMAQPDQSRQRDLLAHAQREVEVTRRLIPDTAKDPWHSRFEGLLQKIHRGKDN